MPASSPARRPHRALALAAVLACVARAALADADNLNLNAPAPAPEAGAASRVAALGRRMVETLAASQRSVVDAIGAGMANLQAPTWHAPSEIRSSTLAARATAGADAAADPLQRPASPAELSFGAKLHVLQGDADTHVPCVSWMADVQPAGSGSLLAGGALRPSMHLSAEWALSADTSLGLMPGIAMDVDRNGRRFANGTLAVTLGRQWSPDVRAFVDIARDRLATELGGGVSTTLDAGLAITTASGAQLDLAIARGLTAAAPTFQAGVGVSSTF